MQFSVRASLEQFALAHPSGEGQVRISVAAPAVEAPTAGVPVLYVVDGDMLFGLAAEIARAVSSVAGFPAHYVVGIRSEERRVGKECVSTVRFRWSPYH